jgi:cation transport ATPase
MNRCVHAIDGRIRIKVPMIKDVPFRALELEDALNAIDGVTSCKANPVTTSVVIHYDHRQLTAQDLLQKLGQLGYVFSTHEYKETPKERKNVRDEVVKIVAQQSVEFLFERLILAIIL